MSVVRRFHSTVVVVVAAVAVVVAVVEIPQVVVEAEALPGICGKLPPGPLCWESVTEKKRNVKYVLATKIFCC